MILIVEINIPRIFFPYSYEWHDELVARSSPLDIYDYCVSRVRNGRKKEAQTLTKRSIHSLSDGLSVFHPIESDMTPSILISQEQLFDRPVVRSCRRSKKLWIRESSESSARSANKLESRTTIRRSKKLQRKILERTAVGALILIAISATLFPMLPILLPSPVTTWVLSSLRLSYRCS